MLEDKIYKDYVKAVKERNKPKREFLSFLRASLKNKAKDLKKDKLDDNQVLDVLSKEKKKLAETKESVQKANKTDQLKEVENEMAYIDVYLPKPLSNEDVSAIIDEVIKEQEASSIKDMGKVMKNVLEQTAARADSKKISQMVRERLSKPY